MDGGELLAGGLPPDVPLPTSEAANNAAIEDELPDWF
jgi:hypothetical protein